MLSFLEAQPGCRFSATRGFLGWTTHCVREKLCQSGALYYFLFFSRAPHCSPVTLGRTRGKEKTQGQLLKVQSVVLWSKEEGGVGGKAPFLWSNPQSGPAHIFRQWALIGSTVSGALSLAWKKMEFLMLKQFIQLWCGIDFLFLLHHLPSNVLQSKSLWKWYWNLRLWNPVASFLGWYFLG